MTLQEYFALPNTPSQHSPVGNLMIKILEEDRNLSFEEARKLANEQIQKGARRKNFRVLTPGQEAEQAASLGKRRSSFKPAS